MNKHLQERVEELLNRYAVATLATCGQAGPQISSVSYETRHLQLHLFIPHHSDHLFNLETQAELVVLSPTWRLHGWVVAASETTAPHKWQSVVCVQPNRLHILSEDGQSTVETIDF